MKTRFVIIMNMLLVAVASIPLLMEMPVKEQKIYYIDSEEILGKQEIISFKEKTIEDEIKDYSIKYNYPEWFIKSVIDTESEFDPKINSRSGASSGRGLMQVSDIALKEYNNWHANKYNTSDMYNIHNNIEVGVWYMYHVRSKLSNLKMNYSDMYVAYNVGPTYYRDKYKRQELYKGRYYNSATNKWEKYNALNRFNKYLTKYTEQCKL